MKQGSRKTPNTLINGVGYLLGGLALLALAEKIFLVWDQPFIRLFAGDAADRILIGWNSLPGDMPPRFTIDRIEAFGRGILIWIRILWIAVVTFVVWFGFLRRSKRKILLIAGSAMIFFGAAGTAMWMECMSAETPQFRDGERVLFERVTKTVEMIQEKAPHQWLEDLPPSPINGVIYRFDQMLNDADFDCTQTSSEGSEFRIEFLDTDPARFSPIPNVSEIKDGILHLRHLPEHAIMTLAPLKMPFSKAAFMEIRIRSSNGGTVKLGFSSNPSIKWQESHEIVAYDLPILRDNQFHTYRINLNTLLYPLHASTQALERIFIVPPDVKDTVVDIDWVRILGPDALFVQGRPYSSYETIGGEMRRVIVFHTPCRISYEVKVPVKNPRLTFGFGIPFPGHSNKVSITVSQEDRGLPLLYTSIISHNDGWVNAEINLDRFAGKTARISLDSVGEETVVFWSHPMLFGKPRKPMHIIMILEDALRADHLGAWGYERPTSPFRDTFFSMGTRFEFAFSQATATRPSVPSLMTSLFPTATGVWSLSDRLGSRWVTLAEVLSFQGFHTASFAQNSNAGPMAGLHQGFDRVFDAAGHESDTPTSINGEELGAWIEQHSDKNFFLYVHILDPHGPYAPPPLGAGGQSSTCKARDHKSGTVRLTLHGLNGSEFLSALPGMTRRYETTMNAYAISLITSNGLDYLTIRCSYFLPITGNTWGNTVIFGSIIHRDISRRSTFLWPSFSPEGSRRIQLFKILWDLSMSCRQFSNSPEFRAAPFLSKVLHS